MLRVRKILKKFLVLIQLIGHNYMTYVIIVDPSMKYKVKKISSQLSYSIMKEISKKKKLKIK